MKMFIIISTSFLFISQIYSQNIFTDTTCDYSVTLPQNWTIEKIEYAFFPTECAFGIKYPGWDEIASDTVYDVGKYAVYISIYIGSLEIDGESYGYTYKDSVWWINGRAGYQNEGTFIKTKNWEAIIGESEVGSYLRRGGYMGSASTYTAILDNRKGRLFSLVADSRFDDKTIFDFILFSFK
jgi:hypothetical protein